MGGRFQRITGSQALPASLRGGVVAIGNFDGVHRGHQAVLERALDLAKAKGCPALVLTFEPHPRELFGGAPIFRLTPAPLRGEILALLGCDAVVEELFDRDFASRDAEQFVQRILVERLGIAHAVTGVDFHFGHKRQGGPAYLMEAAAQLGFGVTLVDAFRDEGAEIVSSSRIRAALATGKVAEAAGLLGYRYSVEAPVTRGKQLGRTLGYPTANMALPPQNELAHGIYAVRLRDAVGMLRDGVASFGRRPTVDEAGEPLLETHVFDFDGDLYGQTCRVSIFGYLRGEEKFKDLDALTAQMDRDADEAKALLSGTMPLGPLDRALCFPEDER